MKEENTKKEDILQAILKVLTLFIMVFSFSCGSSDETAPEVDAVEEVAEEVAEEEEEEEEEEEVVEEESNEPPSTNFNLITWISVFLRMKTVMVNQIPS